METGQVWPVHWSDFIRYLIKWTVKKKRKKESHLSISGIRRPRLTDGEAAVEKPPALLPNLNSIFSACSLATGEGRTDKWGSRNPMFTYKDICPPRIEEGPHFISFFLVLVSKMRKNIYQTKKNIGLEGEGFHTASLHISLDTADNCFCNLRNIKQGIKNLKQKLALQFKENFKNSLKNGLLWNT